MTFDVIDFFGSLFGDPALAPVAAFEPAMLPEPLLLPETVPFGELPSPRPACSVCASLEEWTDLLGRHRCGVCEAATLGKALRLASRAARLRSRGRPPSRRSQKHLRVLDNLSTTL
jgi:hypothetical protein